MNHGRMSQQKTNGWIVFKSLVLVFGELVRKPFALKQNKTEQNKRNLSESYGERASLQHDLGPILHTRITELLDWIGLVVQIVFGCCSKTNGSYAQIISACSCSC